MPLPAVELAPLSDANREAVHALAVHEHQRRFLSTPEIADFLADAENHPEFTPLAVVTGGEIVGFVSMGVPAEPGRWWIPLVIVDRERQGQGVGRATVALVISVIRAIDRTSVAVGLACHPENEVALHIYRSFGFEEHGLNDRGDLEMWLRL